MNGKEHFDGYWWWKARQKYSGVLLTSARSRRRTVLHLNGSFPGFESYEAGGRGAKSRRNLIRGRTADGRQLTLVDCTMVSSATSGRAKRKRSNYSATWYIDGAHFATYEEIRFQQITFTCDYLNDLAGATFISPKYSKDMKAFRLAYRMPRDVVARLGEFTVRVSQNIPFQFMSSFHAEERARVTITARTPRPFDEWWNGPVRTIRSLLAYMADRRLKLRHVAAETAKGQSCQLFGLGASLVAPKRLRRHASQEFLFTVRGLKSPTWREVVLRWATVLEALSSVWALYSAATNERSLFTELRFLILAQALETYHRKRFDEPRVSPEIHKARLSRVLTRVDEADREWVRDALAWSNTLSLRERLDRLYSQIRGPLIDHLPDRGRDLPQRIKITRNYFTHFDSQKGRLDGFQLMEAADQMRIAVQYLLLQELGFSREQAVDIAYGSLVRSLSASRTTRGMLP
jgi:hypothetical protein